MTDEQLTELAIEFLSEWESFQRQHDWNPVCFERWTICEKLRKMGLLADHVNPYAGEYAIQYGSVGVAFFTGNGELAFTQKSLPLAKKICDMAMKRKGRMQVIKVEYRAIG